MAYIWIHHTPFLPSNLQNFWKNKSRVSCLVAVKSGCQNYKICCENFLKKHFLWNDRVPIRLWCKSFHPNIYFINSILRVCAISEKFGDISTSSALLEMDSYLLDKSYLSDNIPSQLDVSAFKILQKSANKRLINQYFNLNRWFDHIQTFVNEFEFLPEACF